MTTLNATALEITDLVTIKNGIIIADSLGVAEKFGKDHAKVLRSIRQIIEENPEEAESNFGFAKYTDENGQKRPMFELTRDGFSFLVMGFTGPKANAWKWKYIKAFNAMEKSLKESQMDTLYAQHMLRDVQISNSKDVNKMLDDVGGKYAIVTYNTINCKTQSGKPPSHWKNLAKAERLPVKVSRSAKEVLRVKKPQVACGMSLADQLVVGGIPIKDSIDIGKDSQAIFQRILSHGLTPRELLM